MDKTIFFQVPSCCINRIIPIICSKKFCDKHLRTYTTFQTLKLHSKGKLLGVKFMSLKYNASSLSPCEMINIAELLPHYVL